MMHLDPLRLAIVVGPLAVYLLAMGIINLKSRPFVTTGARDIAAVAIGITGLMIIGPMELFFPDMAAIRFGPWVWLVMIAVYGLCVSLAVLLMRPRIVIYNSTIEQFRPILASTVAEMDSKARWTGDSLLIPSLNVHLNLEGSSWLRNVQLVSVGHRQDYEGWRKLERILREAMRPVRTFPSFLGMLFATVALGSALGTWFYLANHRAAVVTELTQMLWR
jgi:hypothetical protein